ncbi:MAG: hypothetical protein NT150_07910 [Bacteroidetes bacterium]|nr:hypothetical protein [Bacteroidota bacterium]
MDISEFPTRIKTKLGSWPIRAESAVEYFTIDHVDATMQLKPIKSGGSKKTSGTLFELDYELSDEEKITVHLRSTMSASAKIFWLIFISMPLIPFFFDYNPIGIVVSVIFWMLKIRVFNEEILEIELFLRELGFKERKYAVKWFGLKLTLPVSKYDDDE